MNLGQLTKEKTYEVQVWGWTKLEVVVVLADSFAIESGVLLFTLRGALIRAFPANAWQDVKEA